MDRLGASRHLEGPRLVTAKLANPRLDETWMDEAACSDADPELFFPLVSHRRGGTSRVTKRAKAICSRCPVAGACLRYAIEADVRFGIWGGLSEREREKLTGKRRDWLR